MMRVSFNIRTATLLAILWCCCAHVDASHLYGGEITYSCINACTTRVYLRAHRDCTGSNVIDPAGFTWVGAPGCTAPPAIAAWSILQATEISPICPGTTTRCTNPGAVISGLQEYFWYRDYDICAVSPCQYTLQYANCCRNPSITSLSNVSTASVSLDRTTINTAITPCNNSPKFMGPPLVNIIAGSNTITSVAASDVDGDSLAYALVASHDLNSVPNTYQLGYSPSAPLGPSWNVTLDTRTGRLEFNANPGNIVVGVVCILVTEYRNGQTIGTILIDYMVVVYPNNSNNANPTLSAPTNLSNGATVIGNEIFLCNATPLCFNIASADPNPGQNLRLYWSGTIPGATFTEVGNVNVQDTILGTSTNPPAGRFCWTPPGLGDFSVAFGIQDDVCPLYGSALQPFVIHVGHGLPEITTTLGPCPSVSFSTSGCGAGPFSYAWSGAGGLSSSLQNPTHTYPSPGTYPLQVIVSDGMSSDTIRDTVVVPGGPFYQSILNTGGVLLPCFGQPTDTLLGGNFAHYLWSTADTTPELIVTTAGNYRLTVSDVYGCQYYDSTIVQSLPADIAGHVSTSANAPLANQKIYLILHDSINQALYALDSIQTDANGYYYFCSVTDTLVFLKAAPDSAAYPTEMPTYADTSLFWSAAITFRPLTQAPIVHDFATLSGFNPGGPGFIGGLISQGANKMNAIGDPVPGLRVFLRDRATGEVLGYRDTDVNGRFAFAGIPLADYEIVPDRLPVSTTNVPQISLTAQNPVMDSLDFQLHSTWLELVIPTTGLPSEPLNGFAVHLAPNPFHRVCQLKLSLQDAGAVEVRVMDVLGRSVEPSFAGEMSVGTHALEVGERLGAGLYFLQVRAAAHVKVLRMVKE